jgi:WD40 repeat protein
MQGGVRDWVQQTALRGKAGRRTASPVVLLSLLCASAFCPLLLVGGVAGAGIGVLSSVGGGLLTQVVSDALTRLRQRGPAREPSRDDLEKGIAGQIQQILAEGDQRAVALRGEIAAVLKEIDAGGTALRAAMEESSERVRSEVIAAIGVLGSDFTEMGFLLKDVVQAAAEIQKSLDVQGADVRAIIEQNERQSTDIRLVREDLTVIAGRAAAGAPVGAGRGDGGARWMRGCPYRGLLPFGESDAGVFYGRERLAAELAVKLAARVARRGLVVVTGASGAGKSSLLRAGLLPILARGRQVPGSGRWPRVVMTPTKDPLTEVAARLAALGGGDTIAVRDGLAQHPDQAHLAVWSAVLAAIARYDEPPSASADTAARLVLIVDQFEQVFTLNPGPDGEATRRAFVTAVCAAATNPVGPGQEPPALVVIAVRGDFWDRCAAYPELKGALQDGQFVVGPMTESELRVAITGPADAAGLHIDPALTDTILRDLQAAGGDDTSGVLPLLSQAMALTWENRDGDRLTSHGYAQAGGVSHAVQTGADRAYDALPTGQQAIARDVLRSMTVASRDGRLARRPVTRDDLDTGLAGAAPHDIDAALDALAAERLVVLDGDRAQISHDVLLRAWPRLRGWLEEDQASWILYGQLADDAAAWHDSHHDPSFLYRGTPLSALQQAVTRWSQEPGRYPALTGTQRDFLHASERAAARSSRQRRGAVAILALLAMVASITSVAALQARNTAIRQRDQATYNQVVAEALQFGTSNTSLAAQLTLAAYRIQPTQNQASRLFNTENTPVAIPVTGSTRPVRSVAFSPDGHTLASGGDDGTVRLWNVTDPAHPRPLGRPLPTSSSGNAVDAVAFSPDGHTLASGNLDGTVLLWDVTDPAHPRPLARPLTTSSSGRGVWSVAFSPDGHTLASGNGGGTVQLWDVTDPAHPRPLGRPLATSGKYVQAVAFSPDGHTLASGNLDGTVLLWDVADPAHPRPLTSVIRGNGVFSVAFSPDGHTLASGNGDGTVRLWDVTDPAHPRPLGQPLASGSLALVNAVAFSPDGHTLASGTGDGTLQLWNVTDPAHPGPLGRPLASGSVASVNAVAFSPDGHTLASGTDDGTIRLWSRPSTVLTSASEVNAVAFSSDGHTLASGNSDGTVRLWNVTDPAHPRPLGQSLTGVSRNNIVNTVAFSPNGHTLASGNDDSIVRLWNVTDPAHPRPLATRNPSNLVNSVAFSPDGHTLAGGTADGTVPLWNVTDPAHPRPLGRPLTTNSIASVNAVAFSPDGHTLASGTDDGTVQLWNVTHPAHPRPLGRPLTTSSRGNVVYSVAFSPDGHTLASGNSDGTVRLWDVADPAHPRPLVQPLITSSGHDISRVAFSPDGHTLASGSSDGITQLWNLNPDDVTKQICATTGGLTPQQWHQYIQQLPYQPLCP